MNILVLYTGGTLGMYKDPKTKALVPGGVATISQFLKAKNLTKDIRVVATQRIIDSSSFNVEFYKEVATILKDNYQKHDGFVVLMGTDTMAYVSSLLSFCTQGLSKPIIFTGGQIPLSEPNSDSIENVTGAIRGIQKEQFPMEVGIYFANTWHRAVTTTKVHTQENQAFASPNQTNSSIDFKIEKFGITTCVANKIALLTLTPFYTEALLKNILNTRPLQGLVLIAFGTGNLPEFSQELKELFRLRIAQGLRVVLTTQCFRGGVSLGKYGSSSIAQELSFVSGGKLTKEAIVAKMMFLGSKKLNTQEYKRLFAKSMKGET